MSQQDHNPDKKRPAGVDARMERRAAALRENLKRRKAQARGRAQSPGGASPTAPPAASPGAPPAGGGDPPS